MAWIESHQNLANHPKVRRLAKRLETGIPATIGHLHLLWWWALDYAPTGVLSDHDAEEVAIGAQWEGDPEAFLDALVAAKLVDHDEDKSYLELHDWHEYAGKLLLSRRAGERGNHKRWHVDRGITDPNCRFCIAPDSGGTSGGESTDQTDPTYITGPDRPGDPAPTEPNKHRLALSLANACDSGITSLDAATTIVDHALSRLDPTEVERLIEWAMKNNARHPSMLWKPLRQRVDELGMASLPESWMQVESVTTSGDW